MCGGANTIIPLAYFAILTFLYCACFTTTTSQQVTAVSETTPNIIVFMMFNNQAQQPILRMNAKLS